MSRGAVQPFARKLRHPGCPSPLCPAASPASGVDFGIGHLESCNRLYCLSTAQRAGHRRPVAARGASRWEREGLPGHRCPVPYLPFHAPADLGRTGAGAGVHPLFRRARKRRDPTRSEIGRDLVNRLRTDSCPQAWVLGKPGPTRRAKPRIGGPGSPPEKRRNDPARRTKSRTADRDQGRAARYDGRSRAAHRGPGVIPRKKQAREEGGRNPPVTRASTWSYGDSNPRPLPCHGSALPTAP